MLFQALSRWAVCFPHFSHFRRFRRFPALTGAFFGNNAVLSRRPGSPCLRVASNPKIVIFWGRGAYRDGCTPHISPISYPIHMRPPPLGSHFKGLEDLVIEVFLCDGCVAPDVVLLYLVFWPFCEYLGNQPLHTQAVCCIGFYSHIRIFQAQDREIPSTIAYSAYPPPPPQHPALHDASSCRYGNSACFITL